jgi:hypothetical protein
MQHEHHKNHGTTNRRFHYQMLFEIFSVVSNVRLRE